MNQKSYVWMYIILAYFIISLISGILMIILALAILSIAMKFNKGWEISLTYITLMIIGVIINFVIFMAMPDKILSVTGSAYGVSNVTDIPQVFIIVVAIISTVFQLLLCGLIGRYIYKNRSYFRR